MVNLNPDNLLSPTLRAALREHGVAKLAQQVLIAKGEYVPDDLSWRGIGKAMGVKVAVNMINQAVIKDGLKAFSELHDGQ